VGGPSVETVLTDGVLKELTEKASRAVKDLPYNLQGPALQTILQFLLEEEINRKIKRVDTTPSVDQEKVATFANRQEMLDHILSTQVDYGKYDMLLNKGDLLTKCLVLLHVLGNQLGIRDLTPPEMERIFKHLGIPSAYKTNISNILRNSRYYVTRTKEGKGYKYTLTRFAQELIEEKLAKIESGR